MENIVKCSREKMSTNDKDIHKFIRYSLSCRLSQSHERVEQHVFERMAETLDKHVRTHMFDMVRTVAVVSALLKFAHT